MIKVETKVLMVPECDCRYLHISLEPPMQWCMDTLKGKIQKHWWISRGRIFDNLYCSVSKEMSTVGTISSLGHILIVSEVISKDMRLGGWASGVAIVVFTACPVAIVGVKASPCWQVGLITEAQVPLANHVSVITKTLEMLWQQSEVGVETPWLLRP